MKRIILLLLVIGVLGYGAFLLYFMPTQRARDADWVQGSAMPIVDYVVTFRKDKGRLPTEIEFRTWSDIAYENKLIDYHSKKPDFIDDWGKEGHDFLVGVWRGEWIHYYSTWDDRNFPHP